MAPKLAVFWADGWECDAGTPRNPMEPPEPPGNLPRNPPVILQTPCAPQPYIYIYIYIYSCSEGHVVYLELAPTPPDDRLTCCSQSNRRLHA